jgi:hypothetical protein
VSFAPAAGPDLTSIPIVLLEGLGMRCTNCRYVVSKPGANNNSNRWCRLHAGKKQLLKLAIPFLCCLSSKISSI